MHQRLKNVWVPKFSVKMEYLVVLPQNAAHCIKKND